VLKGLLDREAIKIHDEVTLSELKDFIKIYRGPGKSVQMRARGKQHDDTVMALAIYAGSLSMNEIDRGKRSSFAIL
jgi:hypothetical protein